MWQLGVDSCSLQPKLFMYNAHEPKHIKLSEMGKHGALNIKKILDTHLDQLSQQEYNIEKFEEIKNWKLKIN